MVTSYIILTVVWIRNSCFKTVLHEFIGGTSKWEIFMYANIILIKHRKNFAFTIPSTSLQANTGIILQLAHGHFQILSIP
jgi:hypothetical protein